MLAIVIFAAIFWIGVPTVNPTTQVAGVVQDSAAQAAGLKPGDRLLAVDGVAANGDPERIRAELQSGTPGETVTLTIARGEETITRAATLQQLEDATGNVRTGPRDGPPPGGPRLHLRVHPGPHRAVGAASRASSRAGTSPGSSSRPTCR